MTHFVEMKVLMLKKIILLEDNDDLLEVLKLFLDFEGYDTYVMKSNFILDNLDILDFKPDLIICDMDVKGVSESLNKMIIKTHGIPVVLLMSWLTPEPWHPNLGTYQAFIPKPFNLEQLKEVITKLTK